MNTARSFFPAFPTLEAETMLTFEQFQATRKPCDDIGKALNDARWEGESKPATGFLYLDCLYIESFNGEWLLVIGNTEGVSPNLESLERDLYAFAVSEGYADDETAQS
jgi:hypothetical protein